MINGGSIGNFDLIIMAAGKGNRYGSFKQFDKLSGEPVLKRTIGIFSDFDEIEKKIVVYPPGFNQDKLKHLIEDDNILLVEGAEQRSDSVANGLVQSSSDYVLIHDAARPYCPKSVIKNVIYNTVKSDACVPAVSPDSTVKIRENNSVKTVDRDNVCIIQTPQGFRRDIVLNAYKNRSHGNHTDSSSIVEESGVEVKIIDGARENIKITFKEDLSIVEALLSLNKEENLK